LRSWAHDWVCWECILVDELRVYLLVLPHVKVYYVLSRDCVGVVQAAIAALVAERQKTLIRSPITTHSCVFVARSIISQCTTSVMPDMVLQGHSMTPQALACTSAAAGGPNYLAWHAVNSCLWVQKHVQSIVCSLSFLVNLLAAQTSFQTKKCF